MTSERVSSCFFASLSTSEMTLSGKRTFMISTVRSLYYVCLTGVLYVLPKNVCLTKRGKSCCGLSGIEEPHVKDR